MNTIRVSVVMPLFNKERWVARSVRSVLRQTCPEFELIIVNDGSTDGSAGIAASFADLRVRVIAQENAGVSAARNRGVREAHSSLIVFCDADDEWEPEHLADILGLAVSFPDAQVLATGYLIGERGGRCRRNILRGLPRGFEAGYLEDYFAIAAVSDPPLTASSVGITRHALHTVGSFPAGVATGEDLLTWARLAERFPVAYRRRPTAIFWQPHSVADRPGRTPAEPDLVGEEFARMLARAHGRESAGLAAYLARWHRMRGVIYLQQGPIGAARREFRRASRFGKPDPALFGLFLLSFLPARTVPAVFTAARSWLRGARENI